VSSFTPKIIKICRFFTKLFKKGDVNIRLSWSGTLVTCGENASFQAVSPDFCDDNVDLDIVML